MQGHRSLFILSEVEGRPGPAGNVQNKRANAARPAKLRRARRANQRQS
jgi:hypothetical protein